MGKIIIKIVNNIIINFIHRREEKQIKDERKICTISENIFGKPICNFSFFKSKFNIRVPSLVVGNDPKSIIIISEFFWISIKFWDKNLKISYFSIHPKTYAWSAGSLFARLTISTGLARIAWWSWWPRIAHKTGLAYVLKLYNNKIDIFINLT